MRFYNEYHKYYCGIDLHSKQLYLCVAERDGSICFHKNIAATPEAFLRAIAPFRADLVVGCECIYCWYWLADLCATEGIAFVLGHALYMKSIHGAKTKSDKIDSEKIALMLRGGLFPMAYAYPRKMRATRDLMRRRIFFSRKRAELLSHIQMTHHQYNLDAPGAKLSRHCHRKMFVPEFNDEVVTRMVESDLTLCEHYTTELNKLEHYIKQKAKQDCTRRFELSILDTIKGVGPIISLTLAYEIDDIKRFPTVQQFCSYSRLIKPKKTSAGKVTGSGGKKIGNPYLKWAFSEATALMLRSDENAKRYLIRLQRKGSKARALGILSHKLGKAVYFMLLRKEGFNGDKFFAN